MVRPAFLLRFWLFFLSLVTEVYKPRQLIIVQKILLVGVETLSKAKSKTIMVICFKNKPKIQKSLNFKNICKKGKNSRKINFKKSSKKRKWSSNFKKNIS